MHSFTTRHAQLFAFERNINYQMSEDLKQAGGNGALETNYETVVTVPSTAHLYDLRTSQYLGNTNRLSLRIDPWKPTLFAAFPQKLATTNVIEQLD